MKIKAKDIAPLRAKLLINQGNRCAICFCSFSEGYYHHKKRKVLPKHTACLDHDHKTGQIRSVLCSGCNSLEGKVINCIERWHTSLHVEDKPHVSEILNSLAEYYTLHRTDHLGLIHPSFKDDEEKRLSKNRKARLKRKNKKDSMKN